MQLRERLPAIGLVALVLLSAIGAAPAAAVNNSSEHTQGAYVATDVTKDVHQLDWSPLEYEADDGSVTELDATLNDSANNSFEYQATGLEADALGEFPRKDAESGDNRASALDASEWSATGASVTDTNPAGGVEAVQVSASAAGDTATYGNFSITGDEQKRYLQLVVDVNSLASGADVQIQVVDENGDYKTARINGSASLDEDVIATGTGEGYVYQRQLGQMATETAGDGSFDNIQKVRVEFVGGTGDVTISGMNVEKKSTWSFGEQKVDSDGDGDLETETVSEHKETGPIAITDLGTIDDAFSGGAIHGVTMPVHFASSEVDSDDVETNFSSADGYPSFSDRADLYYRIKLPSAYDLSYSNAELRSEVAVPSNRYLTVQYAEGTGDSDFSDISSWSEVTSQYSNQGDEVVIDDTIQPGQSIAFNANYLVTGDERSAIESSGVVGGPIGSDDGGPLSNIPVIGGIVATLGAVWARIRGVF